MKVTLDIPDDSEVVSATIITASILQTTVYTHNFRPKDGETVVITPANPNFKEEE